MSKINNNIITNINILTNIHETTAIIPPKSCNFSIVTLLSFPRKWSTFIHSYSD